jgi:1,2-dihydroxy-3-keto-5-methylthiopentene dioxygenase
VGVGACGCKPHFFDAGEAESFDALPASLPLFEAFVEEVLSR